MENETQNEVKPESTEQASPRKDYMLLVSILISAVILAGAWVYTTGLKTNAPSEKTVAAETSEASASVLEEKVIPSRGVVLPVRWGDLGAKLTSVGVINKQKLASLYSGRGGLKESELKLLTESDNKNLTINSENAGFLLNLFWALGLGTKNDILDNGPMRDPKYGGAGNFASTGGWTLSSGNAMNHYSFHPFIALTPEQQQVVERVSKNIYRPCCNNATHFPDCNHGIAMLGLLQLVASQGVSEQEMYKAALAVNAYWFPDTYLTIAKYLERKGMSWETADPKVLLGAEYSSGSGYRQILAQVIPTTEKGSNGCGV